MNLKNFFWVKFSKLRNGINGIREFQYDAICSQNFVSIGSQVWKLLGGGDQSFTQTHTHTRNAETRLKIVKLPHYLIKNVTTFQSL